jgi:hypothetical protein
VVTDSLYGPSETETLIGALNAANLPYVLALKPHKGTWAPEYAAHTPVEAAQDVGWHGRRRPGGWHRVTRRLRDGHTEIWWAADARLGSWGPDQPVRLVVATTDPARLPERTTWYLVTNRPHPERGRAHAHAGVWRLPPADLAEVVRCYGLRNWAEQGYKQVKHELGWADFQVRGESAIQRHYTLVCCAFSFCWWAGMVGGPDGDRYPTAAAPAGTRRRTGRSERENQETVHIGQASDRAALAGRCAASAAG